METAYKTALDILDQYPLGTLLPRQVDDVLPLVQKYIDPIKDQIDTYEKCFNYLYGQVGVAIYTINGNDLRKIYDLLKEFIFLPL